MLTPAVRRRNGDCLHRKKRHSRPAAAAAHAALHDITPRQKEKQMSVVKDLIAAFLEEIADFAEPRRERSRKGGRELVPVRISSRDDTEALSRWEGEGGRLPRRRERRDFFDT
jgi:hypothetical protein